MTSLTPAEFKKLLLSFEKAWNNYQENQSRKGSGKRKWKKDGGRKGSIKKIADKSGPTISYVAHFWEGCSIFGEANITDPSGVSWAEFWFNLNKEGWAWIQMNQNGDQWVSQTGIDTGGFAGSVDYNVRTLGSLQNESWSGVSTHNYASCGE